ncbi:MAG: 2Fe-2S iron-sulfur cluster-binding protein [Gammaproteobacteria bacterium]
MRLLKSLLGGGAHQVTALPSGRRFTVTGSQSILEAALAQGIAFPHSCTVGTCGSCKCRLVGGKIREITNFAYVLEADELRGGIILACQAAPRSDLTLEVPGLSDKRLHAAADYTGRIVATRALTHDIEAVTVELDRPLRFDGGQYAQLGVAEVWGMRAYSFACAPEPDGNSRLEFFIRHVPGGMFTDLLFSGALDGKPLKLHGPSGNFWLRDSRAPLFAIAGGSGLAPLLSMLGEAAARRVGRPCVLLFGARRRADLYCETEIAALASRWNGAFKFVPVLSDAADDADWPGERGLVTERIAAHVEGLAGADAEAYLCGPPAMIDAALPLLVGLGLAPGNLHFDKFLDGSHGLARQE